MAEQQYLGSQEHFEDSINEHYDQMEEMAKQQEKGMMDEIYKDMQPTLPDELDKEAKELVNMFYQPLGYLKCGVSSNEMWEQAKKFAIIHCQLMIDYLTKMNNNPAGIQFTERINHYTTLKQKIEAL